MSDYYQVFAELYVRNLDQSIMIFGDLLGMKINRRQGDFAELHHGPSRLLLNAQQIDKFDDTNPIRSQSESLPRGTGLELVVTVPDVTACYESVAGSKIVHIAATPRAREWGSTDFRFVHPDGFYVRVSS